MVVLSKQGGEGDRGTALSIPWWAVLVEGVAALIVGLLLLSAPGIATFALVLFLGWYWLVAGVVSLVTVFVDKRQGVLKILGGVLGILAGIFVLRHPLWASVAVPSVFVLIIGINGLALGAVELGRAFHAGSWGLGILGVLSILLGLYLVFNPLAGLLALPVMLGLLCLAGGLAALVVALRMRVA